MNLLVYINPDIMGRPISICKQFWFKPIWRKLKRDDYELIATVMKQEDQITVYLCNVNISIINPLKRLLFIRSKLWLTCWYSLKHRLVTVNRHHLTNRLQIKCSLGHPLSPLPPPQPLIFLRGGVGVWEMHPKVVCFFITYRK